ncbi:MAG: DUF4834 family protein [Muribaculaceae bacterium]|nr:DUF4834 family protein [Muribaculaceae bacterium]
MFTLLATIFIIYLVWLLIKPLIIAYARKKYTQRINDMFGQAFGTPPPGSNRRSQSRENSEGSSYNPFGGFYSRRRKKIFSREDGEYIDFVEINETSARTSDTSDKSSTRTSSPREPQVSDVEWEDI